MEDTNKDKEEQQLEETQHEPKLLTANESKKPKAIEILAGIAVLIMIISIIWMAKILVSGGPKGVLETIVTIIGCISALLMGASSFM